MSKFSTTAKLHTHNSRKSLKSNFDIRYTCR